MPSHGHQKYKHKYLLAQKEIYRLKKQLFQTGGMEPGGAEKDPVPIPSSGSAADLELAQDLDNKADYYMTDVAEPVQRLSNAEVDLNNLDTITGVVGPEAASGVITGHEGQKIKVINAQTREKEAQSAAESSAKNVREARKRLTQLRKEIGRAHV